MNWKRSSGFLPISRSTRLSVSSRVVLGDLHADQRAVAGLHGGFLELRGHHFAKSLEAGDFHFRVRLEFGLQQAARDAASSRA